MEKNSIKDKWESFRVRLVFYLIRLFYPKTTLEGLENLPQEPCIIVGNHAQIHGPVTAELFMPFSRLIWCNWQMTDKKELPGYMYQDFWSGKPKYIRWIYRPVAYLLTPIAHFIFNHADIIPVYRDTRLRTTLRQSVDALCSGNNVIIFPECYDEHNNIVHEFQKSFVDTAKFYHKKTGKSVQFVPMYVAPKLKTVYFGKPVTYNTETPTAKERQNVCNYLMDAITQTAQSLPRHRVVPYPNVSARHYPYNTEKKRKMKKPVIDYRKMRLNNITTPEYRHMLLLLGWVVYFALYFITENVIPAEVCYPVHCRLDDYIPFCEYFLIFYCGWYFLIVASLLYFGFYRIDDFKKLQTYIMITQALAMCAYIFFPTRQDMRPLVMPRDNIFIWIMTLIYNFDTSTGVCPSLHVAYSVGIASTWLHDREIPKKYSLAVTAFCVMVCVSVVFVKQHSVLDIVAALPVCAVAEWWVFGRKRQLKC